MPSVLSVCLLQAVPQVRKGAPIKQTLLVVCVWRRKKVSRLEVLARNRETERDRDHVFFFFLCVSLFSPPSHDDARTLELI